MKKRILLFTAVLGMCYLVFSSHRTGPAAVGYDCTGAETAGTFGNVTGCGPSHCHSSSATTGIGVSIELDSAGVPTTHYKGGMTYTVKITGTPGSATSNVLYGFQLNALTGSASSTNNVNAGTWASTGLPANTHIAAPRATLTQLTTMEHSDTIRMTGTSFTESFTWTAPVTGTGVISFWGAANFVNGSGTADPGDLWNTNHVVINEWSTLSVSTVANNISLKAFPNPVSNNLSLQMDNTQAGTYTLQAFDMKGRVITTENIEVNGTSHTSNINTSNWLAGTYQVVVGKDGFNKVIPVIKL